MATERRGEKRKFKCLEMPTDASPSVLPEICGEIGASDEATKSNKGQSLQDQLKEVIEKGDLAVVESILRESIFDVDQPLDDEGNTALIMSARKRKPEMSSLILSLGADVNKTRKDGHSALTAAAYWGDLKCGALLLESGADVDHNFDEQKRFCPLGTAAFNGRSKFVQMLLSRGAKVDRATGNFGSTPLILAAQRGNMNCVKVLLAGGANLNRPCQWAPATTRSNALSQAAFGGHRRIVRLLLARGADPDVNKGQGFTALIMASQEGHTEIVRLLLDAGADPNGKALTGEVRHSPLSAAVHFGHYNTAKILIDRGADVNLWGGQNMTPLMVAAERGKIKCLNLLLDSGANVNAPWYDWKTALHLAAREGHLEAAVLLVRKGQANINSVDSNGETPLQLAKKHKRNEVVH